MTAPDPIPVSIAAQVVAAGIDGDRARFTLVLMPIVPPKAERGRKDVRRYDLADWPKEVERFLQDSGEEGHGIEARSFRLDVVPLKESANWRQEQAYQGAVPITRDRLTRVVPQGRENVIARNTYWQDVMGGRDGFAALAKALDPDRPSAIQDPLEHALRPPEGGTEKTTPDIHGTSRGPLAVTLSLERGRQMGNSLSGKRAPTRPAPDPDTSLTVRIRKAQARMGPWPRDPAAQLTAQDLVEVAEDDAAWEDLADSGRRADRFAKARTDYRAATTTPRQAICALWEARRDNIRHSSRAAGEHFSAAEPGKSAFGGGELKEATAAYRLASQTPTFDKGNGDNDVPPPTDCADVDFARRRLHELQSNPSLARLFNFVIDLHCPVAALKDAAEAARVYEETVLDRDPTGRDKLPDPMEQDARFLLLRFVKDAGPRIWTTAKLRLPRPDEPQRRAAGHFLPCTREEIDARAMEDACEDACKDPGSQAGKDCTNACKDMPRELRALAVAEQIDGIIDLGQKIGGSSRYAIITLDPVIATASERHAAQRNAENRRTLADPKNDAVLLPHVRDALANPATPNHRGGGLALTDGWRQLHGIERLLDSRAQQQQYQGTGAKPLDILLDASDLTVGYKLDVGVYDKKVKRNRWHTLMHRAVTYRPTSKTASPVPAADLNDYISRFYPSSAARRDADDGQLQVPAALRDREESTSGPVHVSEEKRTWTAVFMEEVVGAWRGDPLGLSCGVESHKLGRDDLRIDIDYDLPTDPELTPPPLRYGWRYRFGLRAFFAGGVSMPLDRALGHYEKSRQGELVKPAVADKPAAFLRDEPIGAPVIAIPEWLFGRLDRETTYTKVTLRGRLPAPQAARMVVRGFEDEGNRILAGVPGQDEEQRKLPGIGFDRRVLMAPLVSLQFAALHDAFRNLRTEDFEYKVPMCEPRVLREEAGVTGDHDTTAVAGEEVKPEFVPISPPAASTRADPPSTNPPVWSKVRVAWRPYTVASRPRGGLRGIDHRAAWGGFPVYRARSSVGLTPPKEGEAVVKPALTTDEGEILHRVKGDGETVFDGKPNARRLLWSAVGVFAKEEGQSDRSGATVFRPLPGDRERDVERHPYYPDPAAVSLVVEVNVRGRAPQDQPMPVEVLLYKDKDADLKLPTPPGYPGALPIVLDLQRGTATGVLNRGRIDYAQVPHTPAPGRQIPVAYVTVSLAPGDEARIRCWCVPSTTFLTHMWAPQRALEALAVMRRLGKKGGDGAKVLSSSDVDDAFVEGLKELTGIEIDRKDIEKNPFKRYDENDDKLRPAYGDLPLPPSEAMVALAAARCREALLKRPVPEIAAVTEIAAVYAVDLPRHVPRGVPGRRWQLLRADPKTIEGDVLAKDCADNKPLCRSQNWDLERQMPDSVTVVIDGSLTVHGPTTEAVEIRARGTAAARGRFDDVERGRSRDDRARGLWPKPDAQEPMQAKWLFGFEPSEDGSISFEPETVTLLRVEGLAPGPGKGTDGTVQIDLLDLQRAAKAIEPKPGEPIRAHDPPLRASRPSAFPDARARWIEIFAVAISRHAAALRTRYDELPEALTKPEPLQSGGTRTEKRRAAEAIEAAIMDRRWLPATVRPARIASLSPLPAFVWNYPVPSPTEAKLPSVSVTRSVRVRVRAKRPWFSSGEGERLGVVIWPPNLFAKNIGDVRHDIVRPLPDDRRDINVRMLPDDGSAIRELQDADLGPGGGWVTRWGADPIRAYGGVQGWLLSKDNFPGYSEDAAFAKPPAEHPKDAVLVKNVLMPLPVDADAAKSSSTQPTGGFMTVSLISYTPRFDADQETWYVDVDLDPCGAVYPFVRLGIVRYQPNAPRALQVSEPVVEWAQVMPRRKLSASAKYLDPARRQIEVTAVVEGIASGPGDNGGHPESSASQAPRIYFSLLQRRRHRDDELPDSETVFAGPHTLEPSCGSPCASWTTNFHLTDEEYKQYSWSIFVEEVDRLRPGTYPDEPRYETRRDAHFVDTGPRFAARLDIDNLKVSG